MNDQSTMQETSSITGRRDQRVAFYHPNSAGTGAAMKLEPRVNRLEADRYNCFFMDMATQKTAAGAQDGKKPHASFDWEHKLTVKLGFMDICAILEVLEGRCEKLGGARNGLFHQNGTASTVITLQKADKGGYFLGLSRKTAAGVMSRVNMVLGDAEALGLRYILQAGLFFITFHSLLFSSGLGRSGADSDNDKDGT